MNKLNNQHVIDSLNVLCDERIKELDSDSPHGDYIYYSFQDLINREKWEVTSWKMKLMHKWKKDLTGIHG